MADRVFPETIGLRAAGRRGAGAPPSEASIRMTGLSACAGAGCDSVVSKLHSCR